MKLCLQALTPKIHEQESVLFEAFERAISRGTLLCIILDVRGQKDYLYFMNTKDGRNAVRAIESGAWFPGDEKRPIRIGIQRPSIFALYEQNIGSITPMIGEQLRDAAENYPEDWIFEAMQIAVTGNKRNWRYIEAILERWSSEGKR